MTIDNQAEEMLAEAVHLFLSALTGNILTESGLIVTLLGQ